MEVRPAAAYIRVCRQRSNPDWDHAPLPFKFYRDGPRIPLSRETLEALAHDDALLPRSLGLLLHEIYGMVRAVHYADDVQGLSEDKPIATASAARPYTLRLGRTVASGGARYPGELYLLTGRGQAHAAGVYHYDPAHHALDLLRAGDFAGALLDGLAQPPESRLEYALLYSAVPWKNAFKYQEFSYRLLALDIGCLLAQTQVIAEQHTVEPTLHLRFLDHRMNDLLGLDSLAESVYAIMTFEAPSAQLAPRQAPQAFREPSADTALPETLERYEPLSRWPLLEAVHRASQIQTHTVMREQGALSPLARPAASDVALQLPAVVYRYARGHAGRRRSSDPVQFRPRPLTIEQLALLLQVGYRGYRGDLDRQAPTLAHTLLYCVINHVEGIPSGIYLYEPEQRLLRLVRAGECHQALQATQAGSWVNVTNLSLGIVPVGNYAAGFAVYGDRWYRIQNMEAGMVAQRLYLAAAASGLGCRASLSYSDAAADALLGLPEGYTSLIQILLSSQDPAAQERGRYELSISW
jgi:SagB-type dehydrogenase family enzyme